MISRRTVFSLLLILLILVGLRAWIVQHRDDCQRMLGRGNTLPASVYVESGTRTVEMSCDVWLPRQPAWVQLVCLLLVTLGVEFLLSCWGDWARWRLQRIIESTE